MIGTLRNAGILATQPFMAHAWGVRTAISFTILNAKSSMMAFLQASKQSEQPQCRLSFFSFPGFCPYSIPVRNSFSELHNCPPGCSQPICARSHVTFDPSVEALADKHEQNPTVNKCDLKNSGFTPQRTNSNEYTVIIQDLGVIAN